MKRLGIGSLLCGVGLFVYGILSFSPWHDSELVGAAHGYYYGTAARVEAVAGAVLTVAGLLLYRRDRSS